ncbi:MAG: hypothetical protein CMQ03_00155 [Gammaproteobacteria bacterium]|nr:hypothetical protein [Gammaproteobacteria bacterium]
MSLEIEKNVPRPKIRQTLIPFDKMEIGDSVLVPADDMKETNVRSQASMRSNKDSGKRFTVHREGEGCRVFRVL